MENYWIIVCMHSFARIFLHCKRGQAVSPPPFVSKYNPVSYTHLDVYKRQGDDSEASDDDDTPKTGDESNLALWLLTLAATAGMTFAVIKWYRRVNSR